MDVHPGAAGPPPRRRERPRPHLDGPRDGVRIPGEAACTDSRSGPFYEACSHTLTYSLEEFQSSEDETRQLQSGGHMVAESQIVDSAIN